MCIKYVPLSGFNPQIICAINSAKIIVQSIVKVINQANDRVEVQTTNKSIDQSSPSSTRTTNHHHHHHHLQQEQHIVISGEISYICGVSWCN